MYTPPKFRVDDDDAWRVVREAGAGSLVRLTSTGLASVFVPVIVSEDRRTLSTHVAKANPWWRSLEDGAEVLALFVTASAYVSPLWYPSRHENPGVVPTWNYVAAEVRGTIHVHEDADWKRAQVQSLTDHFEEGFDPPWRVSDAPDDYISTMLKGIVGLEISVTSIEGKAKLSQYRADEDVASVRENLATGSFAERNVARAMGHDR